MKLSLFVLLILCMVVAAPTRVCAIDFFFLPDSSFGQIGDTVTLSANIGPTDTLRGFTIYMYNDTNSVDLAAAPVPGSLIATRQGLDFRYADHSLAGPAWLEVGATVFSNDYWAGPGELFTVRFVLRQCGDFTFAAGVGFRRPGGSYIPGQYNPPVFLVCDRVPLPPSNVTLYSPRSDSVFVRWNPVLDDTLGRLLLTAPFYQVYRQEILPDLMPPSFIYMTADTSYIDPVGPGFLFYYFIQTQTTP